VTEEYIYSILYCNHIEMYLTLSCLTMLIIEKTI